MSKDDSKTKKTGSSTKDRVKPDTVTQQMTETRRAELPGLKRGRKAPSPPPSRKKGEQDTNISQLSTPQNEPKLDLDINSKAEEISQIVMEPVFQTDNELPPLPPLEEEPLPSGGFAPLVPDEPPPPDAEEPPQPPNLPELPALELTAAGEPEELAIDPMAEILPPIDSEPMVVVEREPEPEPVIEPSMERDIEGVREPDGDEDPIFTLDENGTALSKLLQIDRSGDSRGQEINVLKPQVDDISRITDLRGANLDSGQLDILKKYISLKESEARDIKEQQRQYQTFLKKISGQLESATRKNRELLSEVDNLKRRDELFRNELRDLRERHQGELLLQKNDYEERLRRSGNYQTQLDDLQKSREEWKEKVKEDLKRIKLKERELENKYELLKRDTQALLDSKDKHVLELKKKNDALELELESLEDRLRKSNMVISAVDAKKRRLVETFRLAISLLEEIDKAEPEDANPKRKAG